MSLFLPKPGDLRTEAAPALAWLAAVAALADLGLSRIAVRVFTDLEHGSRLAIAMWGGFARNLAAIAGIIAIAIALYDVMSLRPSPRSRLAVGLWKLLIATFSGIFLLGAVVATFLPDEHSPSRLVLLDLSAASVLAVLLGLAGARARPRLILRVGMSLATASIFFAFAALVAYGIATIEGSSLLHQAMPYLVAIREVAYLSAIIVLGISSLTESAPRSRIAWAIGSVVAIGTASFFLLGLEVPREDFSAILYGAQRLSALAAFPDLPWLPRFYAIPLSIGFGFCIAGLLSPKPRVQAALAGLLMLSAGCAPSAPGLLISLILAALLYVRNALAESPTSKPK